MQRTERAAEVLPRIGCSRTTPHIPVIRSRVCAGATSFTRCCVIDVVYQQLVVQHPSSAARLRSVVVSSCLAQRLRHSPSPAP